MLRVATSHVAAATMLHNTRIAATPATTSGKSRREGRRSSTILDIRTPA
jgi:hypothetical protein